MFAPPSPFPSAIQCRFTTAATRNTIARRSIIAAMRTTIATGIIAVTGTTTIGGHYVFSKGMCIGGAAIGITS